LLQQFGKIIFSQSGQTPDGDMFLRVFNKFKFVPLGTLDFPWGVVGRNRHLTDTILQLSQFRAIDMVWSRFSGFQSIGPVENVDGCDRLFQLDEG